MKFQTINFKGDNLANKPKKQQRKCTKVKIKDNAPVGHLEGSYKQIKINMPQKTTVTLLSLFSGVKVFSLFRGSLAGLAKAT